VLLYCWNAYTTRAGAGLYFVCMNYSVHAVMYLYYAAQAMKILPRNFPAVLITTAQISQMFIGTFVCVSAWYYKLAGRNCHNTESNLISGALMYGSYFVLFAQFFFKKYPDSTKSSGKSGASAPSSDKIKKSS
jgi:hypothetical protein